MDAATPALVNTVPSSMYSGSGRTSMFGNREARSSASRQCVVAVWPSSRPAAASAKAPVHTATMRAREAALRSARNTGSAGASSGKKPGTMTVSALAKASRPAVASTLKPVVVGTRPARCALTVNS